MKRRVREGIVLERRYRDGTNAETAGSISRDLRDRAPYSTFCCYASPRRTGRVSNNRVYDTVSKLTPVSSHVCVSVLLSWLWCSRDMIKSIHRLSFLRVRACLRRYVPLSAARAQNQEHLLLFSAGNTGWTTDRDTCTIDSPGIAKVHTQTRDERCRLCCAAVEAPSVLATAVSDDAKYIEWFDA